jgi:YidC/Oxa1 family membrane protein insertase
MISFFYTLIIFPVVQLIELCYVFVYRVFHNPAIAILGVSITVSIITLPLYFVAEKYQQKERDLQKRLKLKIDKIKAAFKGDEQYMILSTYYKQNHYHPVYAMRNTLSLLIQIPFFIAAYSYLSHLEILHGVSFLFIKDLSKPDALLGGINILPIFMTLVNIISGIFYAKGLDTKNKIQLYGVSFIFFILLYNSPAGLVLYWTMNNLFSLVKNITQKIKNSNTIIIGLLIIIALFLDIYLLVKHPGDLPKRLLAALLISAAASIPLITRLIILIYKKKINTKEYVKSLKAVINTQTFITPSKDMLKYLYILSCIILFLLHAGVIPSSLIASSVEEFSFVGSRTTPFPFLLQTIQQGVGFFIFWPLAIYFLFSEKIHKIFAYIMIIISAVAMINVFLIKENFGFLTTTFVLSEPKPFALIPGAYIYNVLILSIVITVFLFLLLRSKIKIVMSIQIITLIALLGYNIINVKEIHDNFTFIKDRYTSQINDTEIIKLEYNFSKTGKNVLLIMLDCAVGGYIPFIFDEKPELYSLMKGFHWYPNCASFSNHTLIGALPIYGGYEYTPTAVNKKNMSLLLDKQKEAYLLLPKIFLDNNYSVTITDPPFDNYKMSNLAVFTDYPEIKTDNLIGKYTMRWLRDNQEIVVFDIADFLDNNLIRFSFFKSAPLFLRLFIYDKGNWLTLRNEKNNQLTDVIINDYAYLDTLDKITDVTEAGDTYTAIYAHLPHSAAFFQAPDYLPVQTVTDIGSSPLASDERFHTMTASFLLLGRWFEYLQNTGVYDNTRIILVSDHGRGSADFPGNIKLPDGDSLQSYNALLMVKDFYAQDALKKTDAFMTNGDVPILALEGIVDNPVNPFTETMLQSDKDDGIVITTIGAVSTYRHNKYTYTINKNQWLYVKDNIFDPANWKAVSNQP